jgi:replication-associated recombination protein RarA
MSAEVSRLKKESRAMILLLKQLEKEEIELILQNEILAREALLNGYSPDLLDASLPSTSKKRKPQAKKPNEGSKA